MAAKAMGGGGFGRIFVWAAIGLVCLVLLPFVLFSSLLGASSAATCGTAVAATPGDLSSLGDLSKDDPADMPPLEIARRIYAVGVAMQMGDDRRVLTAYAVAIVESGGGVTMMNVRGGRATPPASSSRRHPALEPAQPKQRLGRLDQLLRGAPRLRPRPVDRRARRRHPAARPALSLPLRARRAEGALLPRQGEGRAAAAGSGPRLDHRDRDQLRRPVGPPGKGKIGHDNDLVPPSNAPPRVVKVIEAANRINDLPYLWGGGHGAWWSPRGYDCSGSVSYALHGGGFVSSPMVSGAFSSWGQPGPGRWITVYSSSVHVFMYVAGVRFDTSSYEPVSSGDGPRWRTTDRPRPASPSPTPGATR